MNNLLQQLRIRANALIWSWSVFKNYKKAIKKCIKVLLNVIDNTLKYVTNCVIEVRLTIFYS